MPIEWAIILMVGGSDAILLATTSFRVDTSPELQILAGSIVLVVVLVICRRWKTFPRTTHRLAHLTGTVLVLTLFTNAASILSYVLTGLLPLPRWDAALAIGDHALGLNWLDMCQWFIRHPAIEASAHVVYKSLGPEMLILFFALELLGHHDRARTFLRWVLVATIAAIGFGILMPAAGPVVYYHLPVPSGTVYISQMAGLRDGTFRTINPFDSEGLVVFPSFHTVLAVLCACAAWPVRILKIPSLALSLLIILSSPFEGGHYFVDIFAGIILAALTISLPGFIFGGSWLLKKNTRPVEAPVFASK
jgi:membrane-associated phospholipid phosphatase